MMFKVRRTVRSGRKGSEWQGKRKLSMRGMAKDPLLLIKWAAVRKLCAEEEAPSIQLDRADTSLSLRGTNSSIAELSLHPWTF
jgi:hypothetical protein